MRAISYLEIQYVGGAGVWCGPQGGWFSGLIPDVPFGVDFGPACRNHDGNYEIGSGISREAADAQFKQELKQAAGNSIIGNILADVYYTAVSTFGGFFYDGDKSYPTLTEPEMIERQEEIQISIIEETAAEFVDYFGVGTSSDVWYDGSDFGDYVCDAYYEGGGGGGRGGEVPIIWLPERHGPASLAY